MNIQAKLESLSAGQCGEHDVLQIVAVCAVAGHHGGPLVQLLHDKIADGIGVVADDGDRLAQRDGLDDVVDHHAFEDQADKGIQRRLNIEHKAGGHHHDQIAEQQRNAGIFNLCMLFQHHGQHVGAAAGGPNVE